MDIVTNDCSGLEPVTGQTGRAGQLTEQPA
jgi:hypothetical protein